MILNYKKIVSENIVYSKIGKIVLWMGGILFVLLKTFTGVDEGTKLIPNYGWSEYLWF